MMVGDAGYAIVGSVHLRAAPSQSARDNPLLTAFIDIAAFFRLR
jgi:hypothetical protein